MSWTNLKAAIAAAIKTNNNQEITGAVLQNTLNSIVNSVGANATFAGVATPSTSPGTPDGPVFWIAGQHGVYSNFGNEPFTVNKYELGIFTWDGTQWSFDGISLEIAEDAFDDLNLTDATPTYALDKAIDIALTKYNDGVYRMLAQLHLPSATNEKAGLMSVEMRNLLYNLRNAGYAFVGVATPSVNPGIPNANCFYIATDTGTYTHFTNADDEALILEQGGIYALTYEAVENNYWEYQLIVGIDEEPTAGSRNLVESGGIAEVYGKYIQDPEWIRVITDKDGRILCGIKSDGSVEWSVGVPTPVKEAISERVNVEMQRALEAEEAKVDKEEGKSLIDNEFANGISYVDSPEFISVILDSEGRVIYGIYKDGSTTADNLCQSSEDFEARLKEKVDKEEGKTLIDADYANSVSFADANEYIDVKTDIDGKLLCARTIDGIKKEFVGFDSPLIKTDDLELSTAGLRKLEKDLVDDGFKPGDNKSDEDSVEVAVGSLKSYNTYQSELNSNPVTNVSTENYVTFNSIPRGNSSSSSRRFIVMNHDDGEVVDLRGTRKIYNKYGFRGSFCCIFKPFSNVNDAKNRIVNGRKLVNDGHEIGLHAIINCSYWRTNRLWDIRPDGGSTFAPLITELRGSNADGTGLNTFGSTISSTTVVGDLYYHAGLTPIEAFNKEVVQATQEDIDSVNRLYNFYGDDYLFRGIDDLSVENILEETSIDVLSKTRLQWIEYYYNGLVDSSLGYSSTADTIEERFEEDYSVPSGSSAALYYPDAAHIINGKMVYWGDTNNPHYSEAKLITDSDFNDDTYQLVGKFTKGLYKGCFTNCNWEVMGRCIDAATAFFRKYYGMNNFTDCHIHGIAYTYFRYEDENGIDYLDRSKTITDFNGKFYMSLYGSKNSESDIMLNHGFAFLKESQRRFRKSTENTFGGYIGQVGINDCYEFEGTPLKMGVTNYLTAFGHSDIGMDTDISIEEFNSFLYGIDNWTKYFFEHNSGTVTRNGYTERMYNYIRSCILAITGCLDTGKICCLSVDTIQNSPAVMLGVELVLRFCYANGIDVVPLGEGLQRIKAINRDCSGNLFPNPGFNQSILQYFGGNSDVHVASIPDGWRCMDGDPIFSVGTQPIEDIDTRVFSMDKGGQISCRIYGLKEGTYNLRLSAKGENNSYIIIKKIKNSDNIGSTENVIKTIYPTSSWGDYSTEIFIEAPHRNFVYDENPISIVCNGYEDNVCCLEVKIVNNSNQGGISLANIMLNEINN